MEIAHLILKASLVAQLVLLVLLILLYFTLWYILRKRAVLSRYEKACNFFERAFWNVGDINSLEKRARNNEYGEYGLSAVFLAGLDEFRKACATSGDNVDLVLDSARRAMDSAIQQEEQLLNRHMQFLATVAGVSPYIGLLGTVWGIIVAFQSLAKAGAGGQTIQLVAPGIAEALVATAMGLLAAIPALIAYNYFNGRLEKLQARFDNFANQYLNILHRNI